MIKKILVLLLILQFCFLFFILGRTYEIRERIIKSDICVDQTVTKEEINNYYNHDIERQSLYPHIEAYLMTRYFYCLGQK